jgi:uncharacterized protein (TIRG00374 family)
VKRRGRLLVAGAVIALLLCALLLGLSDFDELLRRARELRLEESLLAAGAALLSYACIGGCQRSLLGLLGHELPLGAVVRASFVSTVANRSIRSGGATGFALLAWLLARRGVPSSAVLSSTAGFLLMTNAIFAGLFVAAVPVAAATFGGGGAVLVLGLAAAGFLITLLVGGRIVLHEGSRARWSRRALALVDRLGRRFRRPVWTERATGFLSRFDAAARLLLERRDRTVAAWLWALVRVTGSVSCLWLCVAAVGPRLGVAALLLAFTVSKVVGTLSFVPGGLGLIEGSLVGVLVGFGLAYEEALLAALLSRVLYYLLPAAVALLLLGPLLGEARRELDA